MFNIYLFLKIAFIKFGTSETNLSASEATRLGPQAQLSANYRYNPWRERREMLTADTIAVKCVRAK